MCNPCLSRVQPVFFWGNPGFVLKTSCFQHKPWVLLTRVQPVCNPCFTRVNPCFKTWVWTFRTGQKKCIFFLISTRVFGVLGQPKTSQFDRLAGGFNSDILGTCYIHIETCGKINDVSYIVKFQLCHLKELH